MTDYIIFWVAKSIGELVFAFGFMALLGLLALIVWLLAKVPSLFKRKGGQP